MGKVDIWMPVYIGDYLRDTQNLTAEEHGVYFLLLMYYWQKKGVIGSDLKRLAIVARSTQETTEGILTMFFELVDGNYFNKRSDKELQDAQSRSESARANVQKRWSKDTPVIPPYNHGNTDDDTEPIRNGYSSSSSSSSSSHKAKEEENTNTTAPLVAEVPEPSKAVTVKPKQTALYHAIRQCFLAKTPTFANYAKEAQAIKRIEAFAGRYSPDDREVATITLIAKYWELVQSPDKFWHKQPFTPAGLGSLMDRVARELEINRPQTREEYEESYAAAQEVPF